MPSRQEKSGDEQVAAADLSRTAPLVEELLGVLIHDLRSPLGALTVYLDVLATNLGEDNNMAEILMRARQASVKSQLIIEDAGELATIYRGTTTTNIEPCDLGERLQHVANLFKEIHGEGAVEISKSSHKQACEMSLLDIIRCESVLMRYMEEVWFQGGNAGQVQIETVRSGDHCLVTMQNNQQRPVVAGSVVTSSTSLKGRLGNRKPGSVYYNLLACNLLMRVMGGSVNVITKPKYRVEFIFPVLE